MQELKAILREAAIDMSLWGTANAKAVSHLLGEIRAHESVLRKLGNGGGVRRVVHTVVVEFYFRGRLLVETHHELDGRTRQRFELLSGKVRWHSGEGWQHASRVHVQAQCQAQPGGLASDRSRRRHSQVQTHRARREVAREGSR